MSEDVTFFDPIANTGLGMSSIVEKSISRDFQFVN